jgi:hypothetical protein
MGSKLVRQAQGLLLGGVLVSVGFWAMPAQTQSASQIAKMVEALRQAAGPIGASPEGLVSDWKIKPANIPRWSRLCTKKEMTPEQFSANQTAAREILACVIGDVMQEQFKATGNNETAAVQNSACWWMTGNPNGCSSGPTSDYVKRVLGFYQKQGSSQSAPPATKPAAQPAPKPKPKPQASPSPSPSPQASPSQSPSSTKPTNQQPSSQPTTQSSSPSPIADVQVTALVEALRQAAPRSDKSSEGLYSDWQVKAENIPRWSQQCIGKELTPTQFQESPVTARGILVCVMRDVLREQYTASNNKESLAVQRAASWWMTGDPNQYNSGATASYTAKVLDFYRQSRVKFFSHI